MALKARVGVNLMVKKREDIEENLAADQESYGALSKEIRDKLDWFQDQKIGVIFHWGLYAEAGIVESWQLSEEDDWARKKGAWRENIDSLRRDYWALNQTFNPTKFDASTWAQACRDAGFKYMIFTTKHHDGFAMYDTKYGDYKLTGGDSIFRNDPRADAFGQVVSAFRQVGLGIGAYYSKPDWHSPYYWQPGERAKGRRASYDPKDKPETWQKFNDFVTNQLTEISENYAPLDLLWLDGGWVNAGHNEFLDMDRIAKQVRAIQPDCLIVDRTIGGEYENYVTPERKIPEIAPVKVWESNIPLAKNWGYVPNDSYKPFDEILESLVKIVCMGGNVILGVGPKPDGTLPEPALDIMAKLGEWLGQYGQAIYGTRPIHFDQSSVFSFVQKAGTIYGFALSSQVTDQDVLALSDLTSQVTFLNDGSRLDFSEDLAAIPKFATLYTVVAFQRQSQ
jgi:alpha-L-fucosidase